MVVSGKNYTLRFLQFLRYLQMDEYYFFLYTWVKASEGEKHRFVVLRDPTYSF